MAPYIVGSRVDVVIFSCGFFTAMEENKNHGAYI